MNHDKAALVASWKRRSCQDMKASEKDDDFKQFEPVSGLTDFAVAGRYPESDQWIEECDPAEWMPIARSFCDFIWGKVNGI